MVISASNHNYRYECEKICRLFFPADKISFVTEEESIPSDSRIIKTEIVEEAGLVHFLCSACVDGKCDSYSLSFPETECEGDSLRERILAKAMVKVLKELTGIDPPWGILTGIRPAKLMRKYMNEQGTAFAEAYFREFFEVSEEKTLLASDVAAFENACIRLSGENSYSLYVSIPFCPTRCSYCSFVSHSVKSAAKLIPEYVEKLCEEIKITAEKAAREKLKLETVYIGGGTPTSFSAKELIRITDALKESFDMEKSLEFTVEAGRPDTIDENKLLALKQAGVSRISINPQTFSDSVLKAIGRPHTAEDTVEKYHLARALGFDNINMDLIAGLPTDSFDGFRNSIERAIALSPENITVHTLSLKRSAEIVTENETAAICRETEKMVDYANKRLYESGYRPYYMYRQSKSIGNLENTGWCKDNKPCLYNIFMMEEIHTVLAVGASAVTKLKDPHSENLERVYNYKYPYEYISRFSDMKQRKNEISRFMSECKEK